MANDMILEMKNITKIYSNGFVANENVNLSVRKGEIHAICGENGAGKSTLMKVLFGEEEPNSGSIIYKGQETKIENSLQALNLGIGMVHQHFMLVPSLTAAENLVLGHEPKNKIFFDYDKAVELTNEVAEKFNLPINPHAKVEDLPVGFKQRLEILKILSRGVDLLILDEPTAVLTPQETESLFKELKILRDQGYTIIFISHKLNEVKELCDTITVIRHGKVTGVVDVKDVSESDIARLMVGRDIDMRINKKPREASDNKILQISDLTIIDKDVVRPVLNKVSFSIREGEVLGIAGIEGNGQREISEVITGLEKNYRGKVLVNNIDIKDKNVKEIRDLNVSHISEDRMTYGTVLNASVEENLISTVYDKPRFSNKLGLLKAKDITEFVNKSIKDYFVKCDSHKSHMSTLSGGNMQKVVISREFSSNPDLIIANQPTRGIDIGTSEFIRKELSRLSEENIGVLLISADLQELLSVSDKIIVLREGNLVGYFEDVTKLNEEILGEYMLGIKEHDSQKLQEAI